MPIVDAHLQAQRSDKEIETAPLHNALVRPGAQKAFAGTAEESSRDAPALCRSRGHEIYVPSPFSWHPPLGTAGGSTGSL
ncbi:hypothetical protein N9L68_06865 [bacterium]|nr:hypothetical protein [bacterium]